MKTERNILIAFILNLFFSLFELFGGLLTNSISIISDAIHDMGDSLSIGISLILEKISKKEPDNIYTYGYSRYSVIGATITTIILIVSGILVIINASNRLINPKPINYDGMIIFALFGVIINFIAAYTTSKGESLNQKAVNLHMLEDVLGWVIVLLASIIIKETSLVIIDPIMSIIVSIFIIVNSIRNLKTILDLFLEKIPNNINIDNLKKELLKIEDIKDIHHIHIWSLDGINNYATMHIVINKDNKHIKDNVREKLKDYNINHVTIEIEHLDEKCKEVSCHIDNTKETSHSHHHHH